MNTSSYLQKTCWMRNAISLLSGLFLSCSFVAAGFGFENDAISETVKTEAPSTSESNNPASVAAETTSIPTQSTDPVGSLLSVQNAAKPVVSIQFGYPSVQANPTESNQLKIQLVGSDARAQLFVTSKQIIPAATEPVTGDASNTLAEQLKDVSREVAYRCDPSDVATIDANGFVQPLKNGAAKIIAIDKDGHECAADVEVVQWNDSPEVNFPNKVVPIFTKYGCNGGGCHGKAAGQNGFKLSLLGFEPREDFEHIVKEARGRRLSPAAPDQSLLLTKAINASPHGGGQRLEKDSHEYRLLRRWIAQGMPYGNTDDATVKEIRIAPDHRRMQPDSTQQLSVIAIYSNGSIEDVTRTVQFDSNDTDMAEVDKQGLVNVKQLAGEVAVMARYQGQVAVFRASVPLPIDASSNVAASGNSQPQSTLSRNGVDEAIYKQLKSLNIPSSPLADDLTFLRRVTLDIAGRLPTLEEINSFESNPSSGKRDEVIDRLLASDDYADYFANKWVQILRNRRDKPTEQAGTFAFHRWIREQLLSNRPYDQFVRDIIAASGSMDTHPPVAWYREVNDNNSRLEDAAQLFLGQRIQCARCHHHPLEKWSQKDYFQMAAFFSLVRTKTGASPDEPIVYSAVGQPRASHPKSGESLKPAGLDGPVLEDKTESDPRHRLVDWMTNRDNGFFAKSLANRYWKHFMGRALVEPEDDMRVTNPPSNPELLDVLANHFKDSGYDLKSLIRIICQSSAYQRSSDSVALNIRDRKCYSRYYPKRLSAEVLLDAVDTMAQSSSTFDVMPDGTKAIALPDSSFRSYFLTVFGRPEATTACECERSTESTLAQSLHLANSKELQSKLSAETARPALLVKATKATDSGNLDELYRLAFSRLPTDSERKASLEYLAKHESNKRVAYEDLLWALINSKEFLFNH